MIKEYLLYSVWCLLMDRDTDNKVELKWYTVSNSAPLLMWSACYKCLHRRRSSYPLNFNTLSFILITNIESNSSSYAWCNNTPHHYE